MSHSSTEAEYKAMARTACEIMSLKSLLGELGFTKDDPMSMYCDNKTLHSQQSVFHEKDQAHRGGKSHFPSN